MFTPAKKLGRLLLKKQLVTPAQLDEGMKAVAGEEASLDAFLISKGYVGEKEILKIDAEEIGHPFVDLDEIELDAKLIKIIPRHIAEKYKVLVVSKDGNKLNLAMANPLNIFAVDDIKMLTSDEVIPMLSSENLILSKINEIYTQLDSADQILDTMVTEDEEMKAVMGDEESLSTTKLQAAAEEAPVVKLSNSIIMQAVKDGASDCCTRRSCRIVAAGRAITTTNPIHAKVQP